MKLFFRGFKNSSGMSSSNENRHVAWDLDILNDLSCLRRSFASTDGLLRTLFKVSISYDQI